MLKINDMINRCISQIFQGTSIKILLLNYIHQTKNIINIPFESNK